MNFNRIKIKQIGRELLIFVALTFFGLFVFSIHFVFIVDYFNPRGIPMFLQILFAPLAAFILIFVEGYIFILFLPYLMYKCVTLFLRIHNTILVFIIVIFLFVCFNWIVAPRFFSCQANYKDGYYKTEYQACFGWQSGVLDGGLYSSYRIKGVDLETFEVFDKLKKNDPGQYAKDKNRVYYAFHKPCFYDCVPQYFDISKGVENANTDTFEIISGNWAKDDKYVFYAGEKVDSADVDSFVLLEAGYAKDNNFVYRMMVGKKERKYKVKEIVEVDSETFEVIKLSFAKDKNYVFNDIEITDFDVNSFFHIDGDYFKDKNNIYYCDHIFSFNGIDNRYSCIEIDTADPETFEFLGDGYARDKDNVYKFGEIIEGADPMTFKP